VTVDSVKVVKPSEEIDERLPHDVKIEYSEADLYVGRGALKLKAALESFGIDAGGRVCVDIGASTGGFTDCLLQNGAQRVYAYDSGRDQLHPRLVADPRVISREGFNARFIAPDDVGEPADIVVMDVSFISQTLIIPRLARLMKDNAAFVSLVKPQFEAGKQALGKNGIVKKREDKLAAIERVIRSGVESELRPVGIMPSPIKGGDGNEEFLVHFIKDSNRDIDLTEFNLLVRAVVK
jgi:23S rRNA (cytidine1920-2'-O)/16S rRNA (cytidine1409-2'-O)-methyltransferase